MKLLPLALLAGAVCFIQAQPVPAQSAQSQPPTRAAYKVDLKLRDSDDQRPAAARVYSFVLDENMRGVFRVGKKVPIADKGWTEVGVNLNARVEERPDGTLRADVDLEISSMEGSTIHQIRWQGVSRVAAGKPAVISSVHDPVLQKRLDVELTVARIP